MKVRVPHDTEAEAVQKLVERIVKVLDDYSEQEEDDMSISMFYSALAVVVGGIQRAIIERGATQEEVDYVFNYNRGRGAGEKKQCH